MLLNQSYVTATNWDLFVANQTENKSGGGVDGPGVGAGVDDEEEKGARESCLLYFLLKRHCLFIRL